MTRAVGNPHEVARRDELADAGRDGNWQRVLTILSSRDQRSWVNAVRPDGKKRYAPLHQAAWHGAPTGIVQGLLEYGAWRTLRNSAESGPPISQPHAGITISPASWSPRSSTMFPATSSPTCSATCTP
ncbi:hypothetical protein F3K37_43040 [Streptomyces sp. LBUM 1477]|nr:hypothetical protein [Streptomyces sp. LBUM 1477]MBP5880845.1 hypothetical protein [Streptomyces sp. LBUM 1477]